MQDEERDRAEREAEERHIAAFVRWFCILFVWVPFALALIMAAVVLWDQLHGEGLPPGRIPLDGP